jgi:hypothetical protein
MFMTEQNDSHASTQRDIDFQETVEGLQNDDMRVVTLQLLGMSPLEDKRILPHLEKILTDTTPCVVARPYSFGEVRWLAAYALAKERQASGIKEPVIVRNVVVPLNTDKLEELVKEAHIQSHGGVEGVLEEFAQLQALDKLPRYNLELNVE